MNDLFGYHHHHIVFKGQGGLDFGLNLIRLTQEEHQGDNGPHKNIRRDHELKRGLQEQLFSLFPEGELFTIEQISEKLGRTPRYFEKHFRKVQRTNGLYAGADVVKRLMGGRFYY